MCCRLVLGYFDDIRHTYQVIVTGDFFQLPPVTKGYGQVKFAFEADLWNATVKRTFNLTKVFRQRDQGGLTHLIRVSRVTRIPQSLLIC